MRHFVLFLFCFFLFCEKRVRDYMSDVGGEIEIKRIKPESFETLAEYSKAIYDIKQGRLKEGEMKLEKIVSKLEKERKDIPNGILEEIIEVKIRLKKSEEAKKFIDMMKLEGENDCFKVANFWSRVGDTQKGLSVMLSCYEKLNSRQVARSIFYFFLRQGKFDDAVNFAKKYLEKNQDEEVSTNLGIVLKDMGKNEEAKKYLQFQNEKAVISLADIYMKGFEYEKAKEVLTKALQNFDSVEVKRKLVDVLKKLKEYNLAIQYIDEIQNDLQIDEIKLEKAILLISDKKYDDAEKLLYELKTSLPQEEERINFLLSYTYKMKKEYDKALEFIEKIPKTSKFYNDAIAEKINILKNKFPDKAIEFGMMVSDIPNPEIAEAIVMAFREKEDYENAQKYLEYFIEKLKDKDNKSLLYVKSIILYEVEKFDESLKVAEELVKSDENNADYLNLLGYTLLDRNQRIDEAFEMVKKALKIKPQEAYILDSVGWGYFIKKDYENAEKFIKKAYELSPDDPVILEHMADIMIIKGEKEKAYEFLKLALQNKPKGFDKKRISEKLTKLENEIKIEKEEKEKTKEKTKEKKKQKKIKKR